MTMHLSRSSVLSYRAKHRDTVRLTLLFGHQEEELSKVQRPLWTCDCTKATDESYTALNSMSRSCCGPSIVSWQCVVVKGVTLQLACSTRREHRELSLTFISFCLIFRCLTLFETFLHRYHDSICFFSVFFYNQQVKSFTKFWNKKTRTPLDWWWMKHMSEGRSVSQKGNVLKSCKFVHTSCSCNVILKYL